METNKTVVVSGYFDPLHEGHLEMIDIASKYGDVVVILNTTEQCIAKKGYEAIPQKTKFETLYALKNVRDVMLSIDTDGTVSKSLEWVNPDYFVNGGDRNNNNIPEKVTCEANHIKMIHGAGDKIQSSSLINKKETKERTWGKWTVLQEGEGYKVKNLTVNPKSKLSLQRHEHRAEHWVVVKGVATIKFKDQTLKFFENESFYIPRGEWHQLINEAGEILEVIEVQTGKILTEEDIERGADAI